MGLRSSHGGGGAGPALVNGRRLGASQPISGGGGVGGDGPAIAKDARCGTASGSRYGNGNVGGSFQKLDAASTAATTNDDESDSRSDSDSDRFSPKP